MRFAVETWAPEYGSPAEGGALAETDVVVDLDVERPGAAWSPITPPPLASGDEDRPVLFVDGVRRIEARVWLGDDLSDDRDEERAEVRPGICASYAAGIVRCDGRARRGGRGAPETDRRWRARRARGSP